jgi:hypothetical protein
VLGDFFVEGTQTKRRSGVWPGTSTSSGSCSMVPLEGMWWSCGGSGLYSRLSEASSSSTNGGGGHRRGGRL